MAMAICEVMCVKALLKELGLKHLGSTPILCDNQAALAIAADPVHHDKTKHVEIDCHFIRDKVAEGQVNPTYVPTDEQVADVLTKILTTEQHRQLLVKLGVHTLQSVSSLSSWGGVLRPTAISWPNMVSSYILQPNIAYYLFLLNLKISVLLM